MEVESDQELSGDDVGEGQTLKDEGESSAENIPGFEVICHKKYSLIKGLQFLEKEKPCFTQIHQLLIYIIHTRSALSFTSPVFINSVSTRELFLT